VNKCTFPVDPLNNSIDIITSVFKQQSLLYIDLSYSLFYSNVYFTEEELSNNNPTLTGLIFNYLSPSFSYFFNDDKSDAAPGAPLIAFIPPNS
jgi:hypothetical protein